MVLYILIKIILILYSVVNIFCLGARLIKVQFLNNYLFLVLIVLIFLYPYVE